VSFNAYVDILFEIPSDLPGVNPATKDMMILYYCLMTKVDGLLGDSTVFSWASCHSWYQSNYIHRRLINNLITGFQIKLPILLDLQNTLVC
jgi:hypothetical protein